MAFPENWQAVLDLLRDEPIVYSRFLVNRFNWTKDQARQVLSRMARASYIERVQGKRSGVYQLVTSDRYRSGVRLDDFIPAVGYHEGPYGFYRTSVSSDRVRRLAALVTNARTGLKQIGWKLKGDPCSCQLEQNGTVRVYPHQFETVWRPWLQRELIRLGWGMEEAKAFDLHLRHALRQVEFVGPQLPESLASRLPAVVALPALGLTLKVDDTPVPRTLELGVNVQGLERFLGIGELKADQQDFRNEVWTVLGALKEQIQSHLALIQEYRKEAVGSRAFMENAVQLLNRLEGLLEGKGGLV